MEICVSGTPEEIAALVVAIQEWQSQRTFSTPDVKIPSDSQEENLKTRTDYEEKILEDYIDRFIADDFDMMEKNKQKAPPVVAHRTGEGGTANAEKQIE